MATSRIHKLPSKFDECLTGDDIDNVVNSDDNTDAKIHLQCDGKINNITFKVEVENIDIWKQSIILFFGETRANLINNNRVVKVKYDDKNFVKFSFYNTGSVNIQGATCSSFHDTYFSKLDMFVKEQINKALSHDTANTQDISKTASDTYIDSEHELATLNNSETELKAAFESETIGTDFSQSTPIKKSGQALKRQITPKEKVQQHSKTIEMKFNEVHNMLSVIDNTLKSFAEKLSQLNLVKGQISRIPELSQSLFVDHLNTHKKKLHEQLDSIDSKVKHCNSAIDSLHVKTNVLDNQLKEIIGLQEGHTVSLETLQSQITNLQDRIEQLEVSKTSWLAPDYNANHLSEHSVPRVNTSPTRHEQEPQPMQPTNYDKPTDDSTVNPSPEGKTLSNTSDKKLPITGEAMNSTTDCDILILSDSILRKIQPKRFTPEGKTVIRFIRGGAKLCSDFVKKHSHKFNPKSVLIHIGTRDLANGNVKKEDFKHLLELCTSSWRNSKIFLLPILYRKDIENSMVDRANYEIHTATCLYPSVKMVDPFEPTDDMFHDNIHLNFKKGLPAIVKHLKVALNITRERGNNQHKPAPNSGERTAKYNKFNRRMNASARASGPTSPSQPNIMPWFYPPMNPWNPPWSIPQFHR